MASMGHLGGILLLIQLSICLHRWDTLASTLPACEEESHIKCKNNGRCIPRTWVCDGDRDCEDGTDELHCSVLKCKKDEFACDNTRCVSLRFRCDGADDCEDGSDEASCQNCTGDHFLCGQSGRCVTRDKLCDGQPDCPDGQDEERDVCPGDSSLTPPTCSDSEFQCGDGQCVPHAWRCDHSHDCSDGSDEHNCDQDECLVNNGGCSHLCVNEPMGFHCTCPSGMRLVGDSHCEEIDKCLDIDKCNQLCVHVNGTIHCDCHEGYVMSSTSGQCNAKGDVAQLVFSSSDGVRLISIAGTEYRKLATDLSGSGAMAAFAADRTLYWASVEQGSIYRIRMDGKTQRPRLVLKGRGAVLGLAVDWIHKLLYFTNAKTQSLNVAPLDGSAQRLLIEGLDKPTGVAVEPLLGLLFWADSGSAARIERANMDGCNRKVLVTSVIRNPVAISLDMPRGLLYWSDAGMRTVSRVDFEGQHRKTVLESNGYLDKPFGLAVFEARVYWSDETMHALCSADKHNGSDFQVLLPRAPRPAGLVLVHPVLQPKGSSICGSSGTTCQQQCVPDLFSASRIPSFICIPPENDTNGTVMSHAVLSLVDTTFTGVLLLTVLLSVLLVGLVLYWWREELRSSRTVLRHHLSLNESQDPLIHSPLKDPQQCPIKDKLDLGPD